MLSSPSLSYVITVFSQRVDISSVIVRRRCSFYPSFDSKRKKKTKKKLSVKTDDLQRIITDKDRIIAVTPKTIKIRVIVQRQLEPDATRNKKKMKQTTKLS